MSDPEAVARSAGNGVVQTLTVKRHSLHKEVAGIVIEGESCDVSVGRNGLSGDVNTGRIHCDSIPGAYTVVGDELDAPVRGYLGDEYIRRQAAAKAGIKRKATASL